MRGADGFFGGSPSIGFDLPRGSCLALSCARIAARNLSVIVGPLLRMPRVPIEECDDPLFGRGEVAGMFVDFDKRSAVFFGDELSPFFRRGKGPYVVFSALLVRDPC